MDIREPEITKDDILILEDPDFCAANVCLVTGCGTGIGRAVSIAAAANGLTVVGLDINGEEGRLREASLQGQQQRGFTHQPLAMQNSRGVGRVAQIFLYLAKDFYSAKKAGITI